MERMIISTHVPKAAGSTFRVVLAESFGHPNVMYDHFPPWENPIEMMREQSKWMGLRFTDEPDDQVFELVVEKGLRAIHGHNARWDRWINYFPNMRAISWIRHPVDRLISQYYFELRAHDKYQPFPPKRDSLLEYSVGRENRMIKFLPTENLVYYEFIGLVERFDRHLEIFFDRFCDGKRVYVEVENANPYREEYRKHIDKDFRKELEQICGKDMELYWMVKDKWERGIYAR